MHASARDRLIGATGSATVVGLLGLVLLFGLSGRGRQVIAETLPLVVLDLPQPKPPPPPKRIPEPQRDPAKGAPSPRNLRNKATEIVAPKPVIVLAPPPPVIAAVKPRQGIAAQTGASNVAGPGEGAGGSGNGSGGGGSGDGDGDKPPRHIKGKLSYADLPADMKAAGLGGEVAVRYDVGVDGTVTGCAPTASSGSAELDRLTCQLIEQRFRFKPSRDSGGRPVESTIEETHTWEAPPPPDPDRKH